MVDENHSACSLDHFAFFGVEGLRHILKRLYLFYNRRQLHQVWGNHTLPAAAVYESGTIPSPKAGVEWNLGGLLKHYYRIAV